MKRIILCLLLVMLSTAIVYAEVTRELESYDDGTKAYVFYSNGKSIAKQKMDVNGKIIVTIGKISDGVVKEYYKSGKLKYELNYKGGKREGITKMYYENGSLRAEINYKDDNQEGISKTYYVSGELYREVNYKDGKKNGMTKAYYKDGRLKGGVNFLDGKKHGISKYYYENGSSRTEINYKDNNQEGISKTYYKNGGIQYIDTYKNDKLIHRKEFDEKGKLISEKDYPIEKKDKEKKGR